MAEKKQVDTFSQKVIPIMDKVMKELKHKQNQEAKEHLNSWSFLSAGAAGPDGGATAQAGSLTSLKATGKWNSKHTEDYIQMVMRELVKQNISVTPELEKKMIDKMINDSIPKSSIEYIIKKSASNTIFYMPHAAHKSPLENHIETQAEVRYNPKTWEKGAGFAIGAAAEYLSTGGLGGGWSGCAKYVTVDVACNAVGDVLSDKDTSVPSVILPEFREEYKKQKEKEKKVQNSTPKEVPKQKEDKVANPPAPTQSSQNPKEEVPASTTVDTPPSQTQTIDNLADVNKGLAEGNGDYSGWNSLMSTMGLDGIGDTFNHLGVTLAMLPDLLVGILTGKTKSVGLNQGTMIPLASILCGSFIKNPLIKIPMMLYGGVSLMNRLGQEGLAEYRKQEEPTTTQYKQYADEQLDARINNPHIEGNVLIVDIDHIPRIVTLPQSIIEGYRSGALPLNTIANRILAKTDQMAISQQQSHQASEHYEQREQQTVTRSLSQR